MKVVPIAFDSLGVRSMCTFISTNDVNILIDPGASLAPVRYSKPPHPIEWTRLKKYLEEIVKYSEEADILSISHMHYDHYIRDNPEIYRDKILLMKHPEKNINRSQFNRAKEFLRVIDGIPKRVEYADNKEFIFGKTKVKFSPPCWHGRKGSKLGYVLMITVEEEIKVMHCSDVQGPVEAEIADLIIRENPDLIIIGGPLTYMLGFKFDLEDLKKAENNFIRILKQTKARTVILDHHLLRDLEYKNRFKNAYLEAEKLNKEVITAAEFLGKPIEMLEAKRKELYKRYPRISTQEIKFDLSEE